MPPRRPSACSVEVKYVTTMNVLSLKVYYRHLPLYENTLKQRQATISCGAGSLSQHSPNRRGVCL
ncbi:MAG: hypothetical protein MUF25_02110 [Pirellulaceae bacterium]|nr:hypothetical protein [Pirellulaceae bacterium]